AHLSIEAHVVEGIEHVVGISFADITGLFDKVHETLVPGMEILLRPDDLWILPTFGNSGAYFGIGQGNPKEPAGGRIAWINRLPHHVFVAHRRIVAKLPFAARLHVEVIGVGEVAMLSIDDGP